MTALARLHSAANRPGFITWRRRHGWTAGVWLLLLLLIGWYATLIPSFGAFQVSSITKNALPLAFLALGQSVIVISGGIDLSVGAMMVFTNTLAARLMEGQSFGNTILLALAIVAALAVLNGTVGWIINVSRVPDIVVTLATSFIFSGLALVALPGPGGGTSEGLRTIFTGSATGTGSNFWPSLVMLTVPTLLLAWFMRRSRSGLSLYATGSDRNAAFLSGVNVFRAKIMAYALGGGMAALAGLATVAITGRGDPRATAGANATLNSVAAIVLGGMALTGGTGSVVGAVAAAMILFLLNPILSAVGIDPNTSQVIRGVLIAALMMVAGLLELRRRRAQ